MTKGMTLRIFVRVFSASLLWLSAAIAVAVPFDKMLGMFSIIGINEIANYYVAKLEGSLILFILCIDVFISLYLLKEKRIILRILSLNGLGVLGLAVTINILVAFLFLTGNLKYIMSNFSAFILSLLVLYILRFYTYNSYNLRAQEFNKSTEARA